MTKVRIDRSLDPLAIPELAEALFEHSRDGLLLVNAQHGRILQANGIAARLFNRAKADLADCLLGELVYYQPHESPQETWETLGMAEEHLQYVRRREGEDASSVIELTQAVAAETPEYRWLLVTLREIAEGTDRNGTSFASERRFRKLVDYSADVITVLDIDGRIIYESPNGKRVVPWHDGHSLGEEPLQRIHPEDAPQIRALLERVIRDPQFVAKNIAFRLLGSDGEYHWIEAHGRSLLADPDVQGVLINWRDITPRKLAKEELKRSEARLADAQRIGRIGNWEWYIANNEVWWSEELFKLLAMDYLPPQDRYACYLAHVHPEDRPLVERSIKQVIEQDLPYDFDHRLVRPDGKTIWLHVQGVLERDVQGQPVCLRGIAQDITDRKLAEERLRRSETRLADAQHIARIGHWEWNALDRKLWWSDHLLRLIGYAPGEVVTDNDFAVRITHPDDLEVMRQSYRATLQDFQDMQSEYRVLHADGSVIWLQTQGFWELGPQGEPLLLRGISQDITARKLAEDERLKMLSKLQDMQRLESLGVLAGGIAHDFNNLMTPVLGFASLVRSELRDNPVACGHLQYIETAAQRAAELCQQMLAYAGQGRFVVGPLDLRDIVREMVSLAQVSIPKGIRVEVTLPQTLPAIMADANQMRQVVMNLLLNAAEAQSQGDGTITVRVGEQALVPMEFAELRVGRDEPAGNFVALEVRDDGCGMTRETIARIFEPFFTTKFTGRGLGLSAVQGIVRGHHGLLEVQSELGRGTRFNVWLPVPMAEPASQTPPPLVSTAWRGSGTVLVVDDEPIVRMVAVEMLHMLGFRAEEAGDGHIALSKLTLNACQYAAVLLDQNMPRMSGQETLQRVRQLGIATPVVLMTGYGQRSGEPTATDNAAGLLLKPFSHQALANSLQKALPKVGNGRPAAV